MKQLKISAATREKLFSPNSDTAISAIQSLKESGNKNYLPLLFELLTTNPDNEVETEVLKLLGSIKDKETIPVFIAALQDQKFATIRKNIVSVCWQNGMDFSEFFEVFTDLIINEEWDVAFEAFTVIENLEHFPPQEKMQAMKLKIARALKSADEQKQYFLEELLKMSS